MPATMRVGFAVEHDMHLPGSERIVVVRVDSTDLLFQDLVTFLPARGWALFAGIVGTRSDLHAGSARRGTDRFDSEFVLMLVDELDDYFEGRSSSAAKTAEADFKIWLARRSSRFSFSRSLIRWASAVVVPGRSPVSTWSWLTQDRNVSGFTPSWSPIRRKIPRRAPGSASRASRTMRTALSRSSRGYFFWGMTGKSFPWLHCLHYSRGESLIGLRDQQRYESRRGLFTPGCISSVRHRVFVTVVDAVMIEIGVDDVCATVPKIKGCGLFPLIGEAVNIDQFGCVVPVTGQQCERSACVYGLQLRIVANEQYLCARRFGKSCD